MAIAGIGVLSAALNTTSTSMTKATTATTATSSAGMTLPTAEIGGPFSTWDDIRESFASGKVIRKTATTPDQAARADQAAKDAAAISASQGLPVGQYDFTNLTRDQYQTIDNDLRMNRNVNPDDVLALVTASTFAPTGSGGPSVPRDFVAELKNMRDFETQNGNERTSAQSQRSLNFVDFMMGKISTGMSSPAAPVNVVI